MMTDLNISELEDSASKWAKAFCQTMRDNNRTAGPDDEGLMLGWFANAIEVAHDHRMQNRAKPKVNDCKMIEKVATAIELCDRPYSSEALAVAVLECLEDE